MTRVFTCSGCGLSFPAPHDRGRLPLWCSSCRATNLHRPRVRGRHNRHDKTTTPIALLAERLVTYSIANRLALGHLQRREYTKATAVLLAAQEAA